VKQLDLRHEPVTLTSVNVTLTKHGNQVKQREPVALTSVSLTLTKTWEPGETA
jgi:hypothetical protein